MMQRAGHAALLVLKKCWPQARYLTVLCGPGNNGGDGYALAYLAHRLGLHVLIQQVGSTEHLSDAAKAALAFCQKEHVHIEPFEGEVKRADILVDALLGIGLQGIVNPEFTDVITKVNATKLPVLALDIPSGVNADTASYENIAIRASVTATFVGLKPGLLTGVGLAMSGKVYVDTLQLPEEAFQAVQASAKTLSFKTYSSILEKRALNAYKHNFGHLLVVGGNLGFDGAVRMAAEAALHVGVGLVSVATHPYHAASVNCHFPEIMSHPLAKPKQLYALLEKATAVVLGPGLGEDAWGKALFKIVMSANKPTLIDADGLNFLVKEKLKIKQGAWVLTPHSGEAGRLLQCSSAQVEANRITAVKALHKRYGGVSILKGAGSLLLADDLPLQVLTDGNPGMASAGTGDVLSGVIGALLAQGLSLKDASMKGLCLHSHAADIAAEEGEHGLLATDILAVLKQLIH